MSTFAFPPAGWTVGTPFVDATGPTDTNPMAQIEAVDMNGVVERLSSLDARPTVHAPSDNTVTDVDPNEVAVVICDEPLGTSTDRAEIRVPHPSTWEGLELAVKCETHEVYSPSVYYEVDTPAVLGDFFTAVLASGSYDCSTISATFSVNGVTRTFAPATDYGSDAAAFVAALLAALPGVTVVYPFRNTVPDLRYATALVTTATGAAATLTVTNPGSGDPLGFGNLVSTPGETDAKFGWNGTSEGTGIATHIAPDLATLPDKQIVLTGSAVGMVATHIHQRNEYTQVAVTPIGGLLDDVTLNSEAFNVINQHLGTSPGIHAANTPTVGVGADSGSGSAVVSDPQTDSWGTVAVTAGTSAAAGELLTVTFDALWLYPAIQITPRNADSVAIGGYVVPSLAGADTDGFAINTTGTPANGVTYRWDYTVIGGQS